MENAYIKEDVRFEDQREARELPALKIYQGSMFSTCTGWTVIEPPVGTPYRWIQQSFDTETHTMTVTLSGGGE